VSYCLHNNTEYLRLMGILYRLCLLGAALLYLVGCSTEKNTLMSRTYHGMTAKYNGHFNATELIRQSMTSYRESLKENYYEVLPIDPLPDEKEVVGMYPSLDTAIAKCTKVIQQHSMPSNDKPSKKKEEHNPWIDENWTTIGIAQYYRRDYEGAMKSFNFIKKFYTNDPSLYVGELWMAKTNIEMGKLTEAGFNIANLDKAIQNQESAGKEAKPAKKKKAKDNKSSEPAKVPKSMFFDLHKTKAELALKKGNTQEAIEHLKRSLEHAKRSVEKCRVHFVIAQLYESMGNSMEAEKYYTQSLKYNGPYEMNFNARLKRACNSANLEVEKELKKMLRDAKNSEFKDQIYYALADIEIKKGDQSKGKEYLTLSAFYSTSNTRQKGMAYERLGNMSYSERNYVSAQKYYDSCAAVIGEDYPNANIVRNKALKLADLVRAVETAYFEDSVQRIARMTEDDRIAFIEKVIKQKQEEERKRKEAEARRLRELQENQNNFVENNGAGSKWYFNNPKTRNDGLEEFKKLWGQRENEDDWRRSDKTTFVIKTDEEDTTGTLTPPSDDPDSLTVEMLLKDIPLSDSALQASTDRMLEALYVSGVIYKEQLNEPQLARKQFNTVRDKELICDTDLSSAYQLFKMDEGNESGERQKEHILNNYPNSDYANYLRDPNFFIKRKELEALAVQEYVTILERYNRGLYYPVLAKADLVIESERSNPYRAKYMLLKAMCIGQMNADKSLMVPVLEQVGAEYPNSDESRRAQEMLGIIKNGYSQNIEVNFDKQSEFKFDDRSPQWVMVFLDKSESANMAKTKVSDFNKEFFSRDKLKVSSKIYGEDQSIILIQEFSSDLKAKEYLRVFKQTRKHLLDLQKAKILIITQENMKVLFERKNLENYELFHEENY
jgi:tetratricopeptide (TPR) repeat protein